MPCSADCVAHAMMANHANAAPLARQKCHSFSCRSRNASMPCLRGRSACPPLTIPLPGAAQSLFAPEETGKPSLLGAQPGVRRMAQRRSVAGDEMRRSGQPALAALVVLDVAIGLARADLVEAQIELPDVG